jgi:deoxyribose-phosphate aldolase
MKVWKDVATMVLDLQAATNPVQDLARHIQSTVYHIGTTREEVVRQCEECLNFGFHAAMVPARWVRTAAEVLRGSPILVASAVDFPLGMMTTTGRLAEACAVAAAGAAQLDIGAPVGLLKERAFDQFQAELEMIVRAVAPVSVKVMLELPLLTQGEQDMAVDLAVAAGVAYLKNASSGSVGVATPEQMAYLRRRAPVQVGIKASGGIKSRAQVCALLAAGADLVGTSDAAAIMRDQEGAGDY